MKKATTILFMIICLIMKANGQDISAQDNAILDKFIQSRLIIEKEKVVSTEVAKIFNGTFFKVKIGMSDPNGSTMCSDNIYVLKEGKIVEFDGRQDSILPLLSLVRQDFYVKSESDAKIVEVALDKIYPPSGISGDENRERLKTGNNWYFIRGKFFDSKSGYIVTIDKNFRISNIAYSMEAIKK